MTCPGRKGFCIYFCFPLNSKCSHEVPQVPMRFPKDVPNCTSDFISYGLAKVQFSCTLTKTVGPRVFSLQWTHPSSSSSSFLSTWLGYLHPFVSCYYLSNLPNYSERPCVLGVISYKEDTILVPWQFWHMSNFHFAPDILSWKEPCEAPPLKDSKNTSHIIIILEFWCHSIEIFILVQQYGMAEVLIEQFSCIHFYLRTCPITMHCEWPSTFFSLSYVLIWFSIVDHYLCQCQIKFESILILWTWKWTCWFFFHIHVGASVLFLNFVMLHQNWQSTTRHFSQIWLQNR
jgi:hypothetical protein